MTAASTSLAMIRCVFCYILFPLEQSLPQMAVICNIDKGHSNNKFTSKVTFDYNMQCMTRSCGTAQVRRPVFMAYSFGMSNSSWLPPTSAAPRPVPVEPA